MMNSRCDYCFKRPSLQCCGDKQFCIDHQKEHFQEGIQHSFHQYSFPEFNLKDLKLADNLVNRIKILMECKQVIVDDSTRLAKQVQEESGKMIKKINDLINRYFSLLNKNPTAKDPLDLNLEEFIKKTLCNKKSNQNLLNSLKDSISSYFSTDPFEEVERYNFKDIREANDVIFKDFNLLLQGHKSSLNSLTTNHDEKFLLTSDNTCLKIWNKSPLTQIRSFHYASISKSIFSRFTYDELFIGLETGSLIVINTRTWRESMKFFPHLKRITKILQLDRETILTCSQDSKIKMTFLVKTHLNSEIPEMSHTGQVNDMSLFDNDFKLVSVCSQGFIKIWDLSSRHSSIPEYHRPLNERRTKNIFYSCAVIKKSRILTGTSSGTVQLWNMDLEILVEKSKHVGPVYCIQVSFDENEFLTAGGEVQGGKDYFIRKWKISTNLKNFDCKESFNGHVNSVNALLWTEDGFFSASSDKSLKVFKDKKQENFPGHNGEIRSVFVSIDGQFVVSADSDDVFIWSSVSRSLEVRAFGLRAQINCVTSKKKLIFLAFLDKSVLGYDMGKKSKCFLFRDCSRIINKMMVTNDLKYLVAADDYQVAYFKIKKNQMDFNCSCTEKNNSMSDLYPETIIMFR